LLTDAQITALRTDLRGQLILPRDAEYDEARRVFNGMIDRRPAAIARCTGAVDVMECVKFAREHGVAVSVRSGGHGVAGLAVCNDGLVIDLSRMKTIHVDPKRRTVRSDPGVTLGEFDRETQAFGLATTMGTISMTGITGLTLGGGLGWLMGKHGLACDNLISADVVTADGQFLRASEEENADLFWALRGGSGNFGVVTSLEYRLHPLGLIYAGLVAYKPNECAAVFGNLVEFARELPDELVVGGSELTLQDGSTLCTVGACHSGEPREGERLLKPLRALGKPVIDQFQVMPYRAFQSALDWWAEPQKRHYWRSGFLDKLPQDALHVMTKFGLHMPNKRSSFVVEFLHGAAARVPVEATAFPHRKAPYNFGLLGTWDEAAENEKGMRWVNDFWGSMKPFIGNRVYVNYLSAGEEDRVQGAYGENYQRLLVVKNKYDPTNFFRSNQNIAASKAA
jgi:FAD/FMN-containing dehydrogenase